MQSKTWLAFRKISCSCHGSNFHVCSLKHDLLFERFRDDQVFKFWHIFSNRVNFWSGYFNRKSQAPLPLCLRSLMPSEGGVCCVLSSKRAAFCCCLFSSPRPHSHRLYLETKNVYDAPSSLAPELLLKIDSSNTPTNARIQGVTGGKGQTSGGCSLC